MAGREVADPPAQDRSADPDPDGLQDADAVSREHESGRQPDHGAQANDPSDRHAATVPHVAPAATSPGTFASASGGLMNLNGGDDRRLESLGHRSVLEISSNASVRLA